MAFHWIGIAVIVLVTSVLSSTSQTHSQAFRRSPQTVNTTIGSTVHFQCQPETQVNAVIWRVNNQPLRILNSRDFLHISAEDPSWNTALHTLEMSALAEYNNSAVRCLLITSSSSSGDIYSNVAMLAIQGQLLPVQDLHVADYGQSYVLISWSAVFSLDITDSDPDLWYSVTVHYTANTDDETSATTLCPDCTDISYNFTPNETNTDPCGKYEFRVTAVNAAGHGVQSEPLIWHFHIEPLPSSSLNIVFHNSTPFLEVHFTPHQCQYNVTVDTVKEDGGMCFGTYSLESQQNQIFVNSTLKPDQIYTTTVIVSNQQKSNTSQQSFSTFGTRDVDIDTSSLSALSVSCTYASNSHTRGCFAIVTEDYKVVTGAFISSRELNGTAFYSFTGLQPGTYLLLVYDLEQDGTYTISRKPALIRSIAINQSLMETVTTSTGMQNHTPITEETTATSCSTWKWIGVGAAGGAMATLIGLLLTVTVVCAVRNCSSRARWCSGSKKKVELQDNLYSLREALSEESGCSSQYGLCRLKCNSWLPEGKAVSHQSCLHQHCCYKP